MNKIINFCLPSAIALTLPRAALALALTLKGTCDGLTLNLQQCVLLRANANRKNRIEHSEVPFRVRACLRNALV